MVEMHVFFLLADLQAVYHYQPVLAACCSTDRYTSQPNAKPFDKDTFQAHQAASIQEGRQKFSDVAYNESENQLENSKFLAGLVTASEIRTLET